MVSLMMYYVFLPHHATFYLFIRYHSSEGKTVEFLPHDVVIKDLRDPRHILTTGIINDSTRLYKFDNFGSSCLPSVFVAHNDEVRKNWHE